MSLLQWSRTCMKFYPISFSIMLISNDITMLLSDLHVLNFRCPVGGAVMTIMR